MLELSPGDPITRPSTFRTLNLNRPPIQALALTPIENNSLLLWTPHQNEAQRKPRLDSH